MNRLAVLLTVVARGLDQRLRRHVDETRRTPSRR